MFYSQQVGLVQRTLLSAIFLLLVMMTTAFSTIFSCPSLAGSRDTIAPIELWSINYIPLVSSHYHLNTWRVDSSNSRCLIPPAESRRANYVSPGLSFIMTAQLSIYEGRHWPQTGTEASVLDYNDNGHCKVVLDQENQCVFEPRVKLHGKYSGDVRIDSDLKTLCPSPLTFR